MNFRRLRRLGTLSLLRGGLPGASAVLLALAVVMSALAPAQSEDEKQPGQSAQTTTPRRAAPADRFDFRGEHAGVIYTPGGWRSFDTDWDSGGVAFSPLPAHRGLSVYVPYGQGGPSRSSDPVVLGSSYEIVRRSRSARGGTAAPAGSHKTRVREVLVPGEYVEVYHPAVYEVDEDGIERLTQAEEWTTAPKVRLVVERVRAAAPPSTLKSSALPPHR